jgi:sulfoxide reductase catalytic subunit YedY
MLIRKRPDIPSSQITPKKVYLSRRKLLAGGAAAGGLALAGGRAADLLWPSLRASAGTKLAGVIKGPFSTTEPQTPYDTATHYSNFYEFGTRKEEPAEKAKNFRTSPWMITVEGLVKRPRAFDLDQIMKLAPLEERIYRHRCVEGWSIVVPWIGFPLNALIKLVDPQSKAKYVAFESFYDPKQMLSPRQRRRCRRAWERRPWP